MNPFKKEPVLIVAMLLAGALVALNVWAPANLPARATVDALLTLLMGFLARQFVSPVKE